MVCIAMYVLDQLRQSIMEACTPSQRLPDGEYVVRTGASSEQRTL